MHRPKNKPMKHNPNMVNDRSPVYESSRIQTSTNVGKSKGGKITNPMKIPNAQGYVGPSIISKVKR